MGSVCTQWDENIYWSHLSRNQHSTDYGYFFCRCCSFFFFFLSSPRKNCFASTFNSPLPFALHSPSAWWCVFCCICFQSKWKKKHTCINKCLSMIQTVSLLLKGGERGFHFELEILSFCLLNYYGLKISENNYSLYVIKGFFCNIRWIEALFLQSNRKCYLLYIAILWPN